MVIRYVQRITIIKTRKPAEPDINQELQWLGSSLGLFNLRDKDKSCFRIFLEIIKASKLHIALSSDELAYKLHLSRGTVIHHINRLLDSGIVVHDGSKYLLRVNNLRALIGEVEKDLRRACDDLKDIAEDIDEKMMF